MFAIFETSLFKWIAGGLITALGAVLLFFRNNIQDYWNYRTMQRKKKYLKDIYDDLQDLKEASDNQDNAIKKQVEQVHKDIMMILVPLREATLSAHLDALIAKCKTYIKRGYITVDELDRLESDYETYKSLNGNGHMDTWMTKVRQLEIR